MRQKTIVSFFLAVTSLQLTAATVEISTVEALLSASASASKDYVLMKSGSPYVLPTSTERAHKALWATFRLRGETGDPKDVQIVGNGNTIFYLGSASNVISGITFTNGYASALTPTLATKFPGGAMTIRNTDARGTVVSNCIFACNKSSNGGAVYFQGAVDDVVFDSCTFVNNVATNVGGAVGANVSAGGVATFRRCTFKDNAATKYAGAAYRVSCLTNCTFVGNSANDGGAVAYGDSVRNCVFRNNQASNRGGAAHSNKLYGSLLEANSSTLAGGGVHSCQMYGCTNIASRCGGNGCEMASSFAEDCLFREAEPTNSTAKSIFASSALNRCRVEDVKLGWLASGTTSFTNTLFVRCGQTAGSTGVTYTYNPGTDGVRFINCTIVSNLLSGCTAGGSSQKTTVFVNCLFYGNRFTSGTKDCDLGDRVAEMMGGCTNCIFAASPDKDIPGTGNYNYYADRATFVPGFVGEAADPLNPYALKRSAYGVKKMHGLVADWMTDATDIRGEGFARLREGVVDIGCYQCWIPMPGCALIFR